MTLSDFATFSTAISGLAVTASLIYLALQTHQAAKHTKALIQQGRIDRQIAELVGFSGDSVVAAYIEGNGGAPTPEAVRRHQYTIQCQARVNVMREAYTQHNERMLNEEQFGIACAAYADWLAQPGNRAHWNQFKATRGQAAPKFVAWVDGLAGRSTPSKRQPTAPLD